MLEGVRDSQALFDELYRVAKPNAKLFIRVACGTRDDAWQDPAQQRAWTEGSFAFFAQPGQAADATYSGDWQLESVRGVTANATDAIAELVVTLRAVKPGRRRCGLHPSPQVELQPARDARVDPDFSVC